LTCLCAENWYSKAVLFDGEMQDVGVCPKMSKQDLLMWKKVSRYAFCFCRIVGIWVVLDQWASSISMDMGSIGASSHKMSKEISNALRCVFECQPGEASCD